MVLPKRSSDVVRSEQASRSRLLNLSQRYKCNISINISKILPQELFTFTISNTFRGREDPPQEVEGSKGDVGFENSILVSYAKEALEASEHPILWHGFHNSSQDQFRNSL